MAADIAIIPANRAVETQYPISFGFMGTLETDVAGWRWNIWRPRRPRVGTMAYGSWAGN
jgi:hypothetical protein